MLSDMQGFRYFTLLHDKISPSDEYKIWILIVFNLYFSWDCELYSIWIESFDSKRLPEIVYT